MTTLSEDIKGTELDLQPDMAKYASSMNIHSVTKFEIGAVEFLEVKRIGPVPVRRITITARESVFELTLFSDEADSLRTEDEISFEPDDDNFAQNKNASSAAVVGKFPPK